MCSVKGSICLATIGTVNNVTGQPNYPFYCISTNLARGQSCNQYICDVGLSCINLNQCVGSNPNAVAPPIDYGFFFGMFIILSSIILLTYGCLFRKRTPRETNIANPLHDESTSLVRKVNRNGETELTNLEIGDEGVFL